MTKMMKLSVIALLSGTLGLVGCGGTSGTTGGSGGSGTGGVGGGGTGGVGGGGTGGVGGGCVQDCGIGNEVPTGATSTTETFTCSVMGIGLGLQMAISGVPQAEVVPADNTFDLTAETIITAETANLIVNLADSADIQAATGIGNPIADTTGDPVDFGLSSAPCTVCFARDTAVNVVLDPTTGDFDSTGETLDIELTEVTIEIDAAGIALILSNTGDDPACFWGDDEGALEPPFISFPVTLPQ